MTRIIGLISDTHGLLRPEAVAALRGSDIIIHAGDVGRPDILGHLMAIAPVFAVRGNVDGGAWAASLPETETLSFGGHSLHVIHILADLAIDPAGAGVSVVVSGHTHVPRIDERDGVFYVNPGSAGPRRFRLPVTVGRITVAEDGTLTPEIVELQVT
jgi:putative phosphoesterase